jgi:N-acetylglutamate synthase-like GNAT family acetyltransferase
MINTFTITTEPPTADVIASLYLDAGWIKDVDLPKIEQIVANSSRWWVAIDNTTNLTIGVGRVLTDWSRCACIYDVIVFAKQQRKGIGTAIMQKILSDLNETDIDIIHLWPSKGMIPFYEGFGFEALSNEQPMMKYKRK